MNHVDKKQTGFTIIELMLAMTFLSALLLAIAMTIIQIGAIYNKGTTLKEVNQSSRDISDDLRRGVASAESIVLTTDYVLNPSAVNPTGGRLCLGTASYIWNYAKAINVNSPDLTGYETASTGSRPADAIRFVRVPDPGKIYCAKDGTGALTYKNIRGVDVPQAQELLKTGDHDLGIHNFRFITPVPASATNTSTGESLYSITFTIGTSRISALNPTQSACLAPGSPNADPLYCNVQQFTIVVRAGK